MYLSKWMHACRGMQFLGASAVFVHCSYLFTALMHTKLQLAAVARRASVNVSLIVTTAYEVSHIEGVDCDPTKNQKCLNI